MFTTLYIIFQTLKADNTRIGGDIWPKFELIEFQALMHVPVTCKIEDN